MSMRSEIRKARRVLAAREERVRKLNERGASELDQADAFLDAFEASLDLSVLEARAATKAQERSEQNAQ